MCRLDYLVATALREALILCDERLAKHDFFYETCWDFDDKPSEHLRVVVLNGEHT